MLAKTRPFSMKNSCFAIKIATTEDMLILLLAKAMVCYDVKILASKVIRNIKQSNTICKAIGNPKAY